MSRPRQVELNEATSSAIKDTARRLMAEKGTAGLSLRAIAREHEITAPALYHYFASLDELITALIVDAFTSHAAYVRQASARAATAGACPAQQLFAAVLAYRTWALAQPMDFQLIYGNPIPGYAAPSAVTVPAASLLGQLFMELLMAAFTARELILTEAQQQVPPLVLAHYQARFGIDAQSAPLFHLMNQIWGLLHGMVALEIYHHIGPVVGDTASFYEQTIRHQLQTIGLALL